jgi:thiaminase
MLAYKSQTIQNIQDAATTILSITQETELHQKLCEKYGISLTDLNSSEEAMECIAYTRYVLDIAHTCDRLSLLVALSPCTIGYSVIANRLKQSEDTVSTSEYYEWIQSYTSKEYQANVERSRQMLEAEAATMSPNSLNDLVVIFRRATRLEVSFWQMALDRRL